MFQLLAGVPPDAAFWLGFAVAAAAFAVRGHVKLNTALREHKNELDAARMLHLADVKKYEQRLRRAITPFPEGAE